MFRTRSHGPVGAWTLFWRYGVGLIGVIGGIVLWILNPGGFGIEGFGLGEGAGLSVLMLNWMFRVGVAGDEERERHEAAWRYFEKHGHWPDEREPGSRPPRAPRPPRPPRRATRPDVHR